MRKIFLYVSVDDYLLHNKNLFDILDEYKKIHKIKGDEKIYGFFDESNLSGRLSPAAKKFI